MAKTRKLTFTAIMAALSLVLLYLASVSPTGQIGITAVTSIFVAAAVIKAGTVFSLLMYAATSILAFLLVPSKLVAVLFIVFVGWYPVLKSFVERKCGKAVGWIIKIAAFLISLTVFLAVCAYVAANGEPVKLLEYSRVVIYLLGTAVFVLYDIGFSKLISYIMYRILPRFK